MAQSACSAFDRRSEFVDFDKTSKITLSGLSEGESMELLLEEGLCDNIGKDLVQKLHVEAKGNPIYIEYIKKTLKLALKNGETIESAVDSLPCGIDNIMLKIYEGIKNKESLDIVRWASLFSGKIDLGIISFLTALSKDMVEDLINDKDMSIIFDLQEK